MFEEISEFGFGSEWIEVVKDLLKGLGVRFEAEESVRIHRDDIVIEISEKDRKFVVSVNLEIPKYIGLEDLDRYAKSYRDFLEIIAKTGLEPFYELDASTGYTFLRALIEIQNLDKLLEMLKKVLS
jgi:sRNA-binding carbon storage regulator CsrA